MDRRKILYVITKSNWGGAQRYVYDLATNLPQNRFEIAAATGGNGLLIQKLRKAGIRIIDIRSFQRDISILKEFMAFWHLFKVFLREKPDVIHLNSSKAGGIGAVAAFLYKLITNNWLLITIFTAHGWGFNEPRAHWQKFLIRIASRTAALFQDKIVVINNADYDAVRSFIPPHKLSLIHNGIRRPEFLPRREARKFLEEKIGRPLPSDTLTIGTIAELTKNKGLIYLIDAVNQIKTKNKRQKTKVIIIGEGEDRKMLEEKIKICNLQDTIFITGFIPDAEKYLTAFDIFVLPSLKEGLPYTLLEAMAAGLPAIATRVGGIPDIIQNNENGLMVPPSDPQALSTALKTLIENTVIRARLGKQANRTVKTKFTLNAMIEKTISLYSTHGY
ncbi:MAG: glycosyltransferase family 4 protein [Candidatus Sungbacteria bacterium]|nr:glycosyltransferase family 4 protein [Candidatus Sungbacteria bacterium]